MNRIASNRRNQYQQAFSFFDSDGSGKISKQELGHAMQKLGYQLNSQQLDSIIRQVDHHGNGQIDFNEFASLTQRGRPHNYYY